MQNITIEKKGNMYVFRDTITDEFIAKIQNWCGMEELIKILALRNRIKRQ